MASSPNNADSLVFRDWIESNIQFIDLQEATEDRDLIGRRRAMVRQLRNAKTRLELLENAAWDQEKQIVVYLI